MTITLNGASREIADEMTVAELLGTLNFPGASALVEQNGVALLRAEWTQKKIQAGDELEIIRIVAGG